MNIPRDTSPRDTDTPDTDTPDTDPLRILEAVLFASKEPLDAKSLAAWFDEDTDIIKLLETLQEHYENRGVVLANVAGKWMFRTAKDLGFALKKNVRAARKLSRPALETLAIITYHQPVTRAEVEAIRGVAVSKGTLDILMETGWIRFRGRRRVPGFPMTYGTTEAFLVHFDLNNLADLPGMEELQSAGLLDMGLAGDIDIPNPSTPVTQDIIPDGEETPGQDSNKTAS